MYDFVEMWHRRLTYQGKNQQRTQAKHLDTMDTQTQITYMQGDERGTRNTV